MSRRRCNQCHYPAEGPLINGVVAILIAADASGLKSECPTICNDRTGLQGSRPSSSLCTCFVEKHAHSCAVCSFVGWDGGGGGKTCQSPSNNLSRMSKDVRLPSSLSRNLCGRAKIENPGAEIEHPYMSENAILGTHRITHTLLMPS